jgi:branched-chain amino acid aminotransferase
VLTLEDVRAADEVFLSGNFGKVTPVTGFDDVTYAHGPMTKRIREIYMDWALSSPL